MNMRAMVLMLVAWILLCPMLYSETLYVDCTKGRDDHPGTEEQPLKTIGQAVTLANDSNEPGPTTIRIAAGLYNLTEAVVVEKRRDYSQSERLPEPTNYVLALTALCLAISRRRHT